MNKYAIDLTTDDKIIDRHTKQTVVIDWLEPETSAVVVSGYYVDTGDDWTRRLDFDSVVKVQ